MSKLEVEDLEVMKSRCTKFATWIGALPYIDCLTKDWKGDDEAGRQRVKDFLEAERVQELFPEAFERTEDDGEYITMDHRVSSDEESSSADCIADIAIIAITAVTTVITHSVTPVYLIPERSTSKKYTMIFDLDETLVHARYTNGQIRIRPGVVPLLKACTEKRERLEFVIWTAGTSAHASNVLRKLNEVADCGDLFDYVIHRETENWFNPCQICKNITMLGRPKGTAVLIDNSIGVTDNSPETASASVIVSDFNHNSGSSESGAMQGLLDLVELLYSHTYSKNPDGITDLLDNNKNIITRDRKVEHVIYGPLSCYTFVSDQKDNQITKIEIEINKPDIYESKDISGYWWPITVLSVDGGSITAHVHDATRDITGKVIGQTWEKVHPANIRLK